MRRNNGSSSVIEIVRDIIMEYYGLPTWIIVERHIHSKNIDIENLEDVLEVIREFFAGSEEVVNIIYSKIAQKTRSY